MAWYHGRGVGFSCQHVWCGKLSFHSGCPDRCCQHLGHRADMASPPGSGFPVYTHFPNLRFRWQIPPIAKVTFTGILPPGVTGKDVIVALCGLFNNDEVLNHAIEFTGSEQTMRSIPVDDRLTIANMTTGTI